ncbi:MAG: aspartate kinase [Flavobacteriaceae bacterium]|nr:MAG: aspartate kinase [Flavobacteriaceae bacterium]
MKVFKFGGASVKSAASIKNVVRVLKHEGFDNTIVVISAMGKITNAFEKVIDDYVQQSTTLNQSIDFIRDYHVQICSDLFQKDHAVFREIEIIFGKLSGFLSTNRSQNYDFIYDQIVKFGELLSTKIVSSYLNHVAIPNTWLDVRTCIHTDNNFRDAKVDWERTETNIRQQVKSNLTITQGFIAGGGNNQTTTLGREGSDFTAAIFAFCLNAKNVTIWKDVDGVLNADPRCFKNTILLQKISYKEAIEMSFYGASVIHPKTLKPLENKKIPLFVRSFEDLKNTGTIVLKGEAIVPETPCFIQKKHQYLVSISAKDFSFMVESNLSHIFKLLGDFKLKVNLIQNSALSFSVCIEDNYHQFDAFIKAIQQEYTVYYNSNITLYTIRHATSQAIDMIETKGQVLLKQATKQTVQILINPLETYKN